MWLCRQHMIQITHEHLKLAFTIQQRQKHVKAGLLKYILVSQPDLLFWGVFIEVFFFSCHLFNLKWVSDLDLIFMAQQLGVKDVTDVKFAENKVNGQSRGWVVQRLGQYWNIDLNWNAIICVLSALLSSYAEMTVSSQESLKTLLDKIPECKLNGENLNCRFATHHNLSVFEDVAKLRKSPTFFSFFYHKFDLHWISIHQKLFVSLVGMPLRVQSKDSKESESSGGPSFFSPEPVPPPAPLPSPFPPLPNPFLAQPPPHLFPHFPPNIPPPPLPPPLFPPPPIHSPCQPSGLHLNPPTVSAGNGGQSSEAYNQPSWENGLFFFNYYQSRTRKKKSKRKKSSNKL